MNTEPRPLLPEQTDTELDRKFYEIVGSLAIRTGSYIEHTEHAVTRRTHDVDWSQFAHSDDNLNIIEGNN